MENIITDLAEKMSMCWLLRVSDLASMASVTSPSSMRTPPIPAPYAIPTPHSELLAVAATSPAQRVPGNGVVSSYICNDI